MSDERTVLARLDMHKDCTLRYHATVLETNKAYFEDGRLRVGKNVEAWTRSWSIQCSEHVLVLCDENDEIDLEFDI